MSMCPQLLDCDKLEFNNKVKWVVLQQEQYLHKQEDMLHRVMRWKSQAKKEAFRTENINTGKIEQSRRERERVRDVTFSVILQLNF